MKPLYVKKNGVVYRVSGTGIPSIYPAANVEYDNTVTSELQATDVQDAIDELSTRQGGVQSDWDEDDSSELDYIKNKPQNLVQDASYVHTDNNYDATAKGKVDALGTAASKDAGVANGVAELDAAGKVPSSQLPSFVDDVIEVADYDHLPITGESGKIYVTLDTNKTYRWTGSGYAEISESLALGETSSTAYRGDRGKTAYDHSQDSGRITAVVSSGLYKFSATAEGHISGTTAVQKSDITALGIPAQDTTYGVVSKTANGLAPQLPNETTTTKYLRQDGSWQVPPDNNTTYSAGNGLTLTGTSFNVGKRWNAVTQGQKWSRLYLATPVNLTEGTSGILAVSCTRGSTVCNATFLITTSHAGATYSNTIELASCNYTQVRSRIVVNTNGLYYFEIYDDKTSIAVGTAQTWHCCFIPLLDTTLTCYTTFTDGTTVPSGYTAGNDFTTTAGNTASAIKNITRSGTTFTATRQDGSTFTFTQQDSTTDNTKVPLRTNGYGYTPALSAYWGGSGGKYFRITIPQKGQTWCMIYLELSLRIYNTQQHGKVLVRGQWSSSANWNELKAILVGDLIKNANLQVYASDKKYIYVYCNYTYVTLSVDKMLVGDNATSYDLSEISLDTTSALPSTYQTATMAITNAGNAETVNGLTLSLVT